MSDTGLGARVHRRTNSTPALTSITEGRCALVLPPSWPAVLTESRRTRYESYASGMSMREDRLFVHTLAAAVTTSKEMPSAEPIAVTDKDTRLSTPPPTAATAEESSSATTATSRAAEKTAAATRAASDHHHASPPPESTDTENTEKKTADVAGEEPSDREVTTTETTAPRVGPVEGSDAADQCAGSRVDASNASDTPTPPRESAPDDHARHEKKTVEPYDADKMPAWLKDFRDTVDFCPLGVRQFVLKMESHAAAGGGGGPSSSFGPARSTFGGGYAPKPFAPLGFKFTEGHPPAGHHPHHGSPAFGGSSGGMASSHHSSASLPWSVAPGGHGGKSGLEAIEQLWEDRKDMPIAIGNSMRRRGLFGDAERKEIHHMVTAVLNKVTTDPNKFREVKNELLRLPIPEANATQLDSVVDVFVHKAISEPDFSHSYADLLAALCKVPQGQEVSGDKRGDTLEYRLRRAIVKRCQTKFMEGTASQAEEHARLIGRVAQQQGVAPECITGIPFSEYDLALLADQGGEDHEEAETRTKELRDTMCGIVRFVSELYLRHMISPNVLTVLFFVCLTGSGEGDLTPPPTYLPTESQLDEVMTILRTAGKAYLLETSKGRGMLPCVLHNLEYWMAHYPVSRIRFLLITEAETLRQWRQLLHRDAVPSTPHSASASPPHHAAAAPPPVVSSGAHGAARVGTQPQTSFRSATHSQHPSPLPASALGLPPTEAGHPASGASPTLGHHGIGGGPAHTTAAPTPSHSGVYSNTSTGNIAVSAGHEVSAQGSSPPNSQTGSPKTGIPAPRSRVASAAAAAAAAAAGGSARGSPAVNTPPPPASFEDAGGNKTMSDGQPSVPTPAPLATSSSASASVELPTGPVKTVRPPLKQAVRVTHIAELMTKMTKVDKDDSAAMSQAAESVAMSMAETYGDVLPCLAKWFDRCLTVVREDKARQRTARVLQHAMNAGPAPPSRDELRDTAVSALERAVLANLHDELHIFRFWAQMVIADEERQVLDEEMLNEGLAMVLACCPSATTDYLEDVGKLHSAMLQAETYAAPAVCSHATLYPRYRPLLWVYNAHAEHAPDRVVPLLDKPALRQQSLEIALFTALVTGHSSPDTIFSELRQCPRLVRTEATIAAEVMSAIMMAEICSAFKPFVENNIVLMQTAVDGVNRRERERAILAEIHYITHYAQCPFPVGCELRLAHKLVNLRVVSGESAEETAAVWEHQQALAASGAALQATEDARGPHTDDASAPNAHEPTGITPAPHTTVSSPPTSGSMSRGAAGGGGGADSGAFVPSPRGRGRSVGGLNTGARANNRNGGAHGGGAQNVPASTAGSFGRTSSVGGSSDTNSNTYARGHRGSVPPNASRGTGSGVANAAAAAVSGQANGCESTPTATGSEHGGQPRGSQVSHGSFSLNSSGTGSRLGGGGSPAGAGGGSSGGRWGTFGSSKSTRSASDTFDAVSASYRAKYLASAGSGAGSAGGRGAGERKRGGRGGGRGRK